MKHKDDNWHNSSDHEVHEKGHDLCNSVRSEEECRDIREGHDDDRVEHYELPYTCVLQVKGYGQENDYDYRYVRFHYISDNSRDPVGGQAHSGDDLHVFELLFALLDYK